MRSISPVALLLASVWQRSLAFIPTGRNSVIPHSRSSSRQQRQQLHLFPAVDASSFLIATIDSDIANIPDNEFAPVFMGGMMVMMGGVLSALFVGTVVDQKNMYGQLVGDNYAQAADDEDFWNSLSEEDRVKAKELLARLSDEDGGKEALKELQEIRNQPVSAQTTSPSTATTTSSASTVDKKTDDNATKQKEIGMFSDYAE